MGDGGVSFEEAVKRRVRKELATVADDLERDAVSRETMYKDIGFEEIAVREAWDLREVAARVRKRIEAFKL